MMYNLAPKTPRSRMSRRNSTKLILSSTGISIKKVREQEQNEDSPRVKFHEENVESSNENQIELLSDCLRVFSKANRNIQKIEKVLKYFLSFTKASHLFYTKLNDNGKLVIDTSYENGEWNHTKNRSIDNSNYILKCILDECKKSNEPVYVVSNHELKWLFKNNDCAAESILCIPVIISKKLVGCLYLVHETLKMAFDHITKEILMLLTTSLLLSTSYMKDDNARKPSLDVKDTEIILQDTVTKLYNV